MFHIHSLKHNANHNILSGTKLVTKTHVTKLEKKNGQSDIDYHVTLDNTTQECYLLATCKIQHSRTVPKFSRTALLCVLTLRLTFHISIFMTWMRLTYDTVDCTNTRCLAGLNESWLENHGAILLSGISSNANEWTTNKRPAHLEDETYKKLKIEIESYQVMQWKYAESTNISLHELASKGVRQMTKGDLGENNNAICTGGQPKTTHN